MLIKFRCISAFVLCVFFYSVTSYAQTVKFAAIGDYGKWENGEGLVSSMVHSRNPDFIITLGDNNYEYGSDTTIDSNIGKFYHDYIHPYNGIFGPGAAFNKFFPSLGNHDWINPNADAYLNYFTLPGNERYYSFVKGNCEFFVIDSDPNEPDGTDSLSVQADWLRIKLRDSNARFKIVYFHHPPYSSGQHGNSAYMQWPFKKWGATVVLCGHEHNYERLVVNGMTYFINGLGGKDWREFLNILPESRVRYTGNHGAMFITAYNDSINFKFYTISDSLKDDTTLIAPPIGITMISETADHFSLSQNYPNPFNPETKIRFTLPAGEDNFVKLSIYDIRGKEIAILVNGRLTRGEYEVVWSADGGASQFSSGVYFYSLFFGTDKVTKRMILIK